MRGAWIIAAAVVVRGVAASLPRAGVYFTAGARWPAVSAVQVLPVPGLGRLPRSRQLPTGLPRTTGTAACRPRIAWLASTTSDASQELEARKRRGLLSLDRPHRPGGLLPPPGQVRRGRSALLEPRRSERPFPAAWPTWRRPTSWPARRDLALRIRRAGPGRLAARPIAGWDTDQVNFYRKAEQYHLKLLTAALRSRSAAGSRTALLRLDNLFPASRFVGPQRRVRGRQHRAGPAGANCRSMPRPW